MSMNMQALRIAGFLAAGALLTAACSRQQPASDASADAPAPPATPPAEISIPGTGVYPESITSAADGSIYVGSIGLAQVFRAPPGAAAAEVFIPPGTGGLKQVFGVLADDASGTLWACSNDLGGGPPGAAPPKSSAVHAFDLASGAAKASYPLPAGSMCNDMAVASNGDLLVSETNDMRVLRLPKDGPALQVWSPAGAYGPPGGVLDGIAVVGSRVIVNTLLTNKLFATEIAADGTAGAVQELTLSAPLSGPDGMRSHGTDGVLVTDGTGKVLRVTISGDAATVTTVKDGLEAPVSVATVGNYAYALEGQLALLFAPGSGAEKPYRAVGFALP